MNVLMLLGVLVTGATEVVQPEGMTGFYTALAVLIVAVARELQHRKRTPAAPKCALDGADRDVLLGVLREHTVILQGLRDDLRERLPATRRAS